PSHINLVAVDKSASSRTVLTSVDISSLTFMIQPLSDCGSAWRTVAMLSNPRAMRRAEFFEPKSGTPSIRPLQRIGITQQRRTQRISREQRALALRTRTARVFVAEIRRSVEVLLKPVPRECGHRFKRPRLFE